MHGRNKAFLRLSGRHFLDCLLTTLSSLFSECMIVTREPALYHQFNMKIVVDQLHIRSPLTGIHAALKAMSSDFAFVTGCDAPLLKPEVVKVLIDTIVPDVDIVVPASGSYYQPLCALYSKRCADTIAKHLMKGDVKIDHIFNEVRLKTVPYARLKAADPQLISFFNINTPEDLQKAASLV